MLESSSPVSAHHIAVELCAFLQTQLKFPHLLDAQARLEELGVDSFSLMELMLFVEQRYGRAIPLELLTPENVCTLETLSSCIASVLENENSTLVS